MRNIPALRLILARNSNWHSIALTLIGVVIFNFLPIKYPAVQYIIATILLALLFTRLISESETWRSTQWIAAIAIIVTHFLTHPLSLENLTVILSIWAMVSGMLGLIWSDRHG